MRAALEHLLLLGLVTDLLQVARDIVLALIAQPILALRIVPLHGSQVVIEVLIDLDFVLGLAGVHLAGAIVLVGQSDRVLLDHLPVDQDGGVA